MNLESILFSLLALAILLMLYGFFLSPIVTYIKFGLQIGFDKVALIYKPFQGFLKVSHDSTKKYGSSFGVYLHEIKVNPMLKIIVAKIFFATQIMIVDSETIRKLSYDYVKNLEKANILIFSSEITQGLLFQEREQWKKSRGIISNVFHFQMLKARQYLMEKVIQEKTKNLEEGLKNLYEFGQSIGGQIVVKSLFGEQFFSIKIDGKNTYQQIHQILYTILDESFTVNNILRYVFYNVATKDSWLLTQNQKKLLARIMNFKKIAKQFLDKQKILYDNKKQVPPFIEAYFKLNDESLFEEIVHQLFFFLFAAEDTTGGAIEMSLALLATYPEYQERILKDVEETSIHSSKQLNNFLNEMGRLHAVVPTSSLRKVIKSFTCDGIKFQKGHEISFSLGSPMINPRYWENPEEFRPQRFNKPLENPSAFLPFSSGPRNCIGQHMALMEIRITIVRVLQKYKLEKIGKSLDTNAGLNIINHLIEPKFVKFHRKIK